MEGVTDPKMLEGRAFYKLGEFTFDHRKKVLVVGILACIAMSSLMIMGPNWAESWGEGDLESMNAARIYDDAFTSDEIESTADIADSISPIIFKLDIFFNASRTNKEYFKIL